MDMYCPFCGSNQIEVTNSRPTKSGSQIWRRRKCMKCGNNFSTYERINLSHLIVIKQSRTRQKYSRAKLYSGIYHCSLDRKHSDRVSLSTLTENLTSLVEKEILELHKKVVTSEEIKHIVLTVLSTKAPDSFLRFIAHRESADTKALKKSLKKYSNNF